MIVFPDFNQGLSFCCDANAVVLDERERELFYKYYQLSQNWGQKINFTANLTLSDYLCENVMDPLLAFKLFVDKFGVPNELVDLGAGGGYVGLTAKILFPEVKLYLVDSVRKKVSFMQAVIRDLGLREIQAVHCRAEDFIPPSSCDLIVSRATWNWQDLLMIFHKFLQNGKRLLSFEGPSALEELEIQPKQVLSYSIKPFAKERYLFCA